MNSTIGVEFFDAGFEQQSSELVGWSVASTEEGRPKPAVAVATAKGIDGLVAEATHRWAAERKLR